MKKKKGCIFCIAKKKETPDADNRYILRKTTHSFSILNRYPYNNAHVMIAPYRHVGWLGALSEEELLDLMKLLNYTKKKIDRLLSPVGFNIGINVGKIAGAGFPGHVHIHVVPRWAGDTNFMPVTAETKVVSCSLKEMWNLLRK